MGDLKSMEVGGLGRSLKTVDFTLRRLTPLSRQWKENSSDL